MAIPNSKPFQLKVIFTFLLVLAHTFTFATADRILDEESVVTPTPVVTPEAPDSDTDGVAPASAGVGLPTSAGGTGAAGVAVPGGVGAAGVVAPGGAGAGAATTATAGATVGEDDHIFSFFLHDILGGSNPSAIAVTGIATNPSLSGQVPFAKPNGAVLAVNNGVPDRDDLKTPLTSKTKDVTDRDAGENPCHAGTESITRRRFPTRLHFKARDD